MRTHSSFVRLLVASVSLSVVVVACKSGTGSEPLTPQKLSEGLLTITDLNSEWNETQRQTFTTRGNENPSIDPSTFCPDAKDAATSLLMLAGAAGADVEMEFKGLSGHARLLRQQAWNDENAEQYMTTLSAAVDTCDGKSWSEENGVGASVAKLAPAGEGDDSVGFKTTLVPPPGTGSTKSQSQGRIIVVRVRDVVMVLQVGDFALGGTSDLMTDAAWNDLVAAAVGKIEDL